jgi:hypothetical protein
VVASRQTCEEVVLLIEGADAKYMLAVQPIVRAVSALLKWCDEALAERSSGQLAGLLRWFSLLLLVSPERTPVCGVSIIKHSHDSTY